MKVGIKPDVAAKILGAKEGEKFLLVDTLGTALGTTNKDYDGKTAQAFLGEKGLKGDKGEAGTPGLKGDDGVSPAAAEVAADLTLKAALQNALASDKGFQTAVQVSAVASDPTFQKAVAAKMPQPVMSESTFDIPQDGALDWNF